MYRFYLPDHNGMLFHFNPPQKIPIWMKNTFIPLDIIWLDRHFKIVDIYLNTHPYSTTPIHPKEKASYVLEVNSGTVQKFHLKKGTQINALL
jgi:uncharacterized membrane protein (UPF0127 family)